MSFGGTFPARSFLLLPGKMKGGQHPKTSLHQRPQNKMSKTLKQKERNCVMKTTKKSMTMKIVSIMLSIIMIAGILPIAVFATEPADTAEYVYISVSYDDKFKKNKNRL